MKAIEADLVKARNSNTSKPPQKVDESWTVSDNTVKSPLKRSVVSNRPTSRKKKAVSGEKAGSLARGSPLRSQGGPSELDFWAFSKDR
jgi:hypothetical protein